MKLIIATVLILSTVALTTITAAPSRFQINEELNNEWEIFKFKYEKKYESPVIELGRRLIWQENLKNIAKHNLEHDMGTKSYSMGVNQFTDLTHDEFKNKHLGGYKGNTKEKKSGIEFRKPLNMIQLPEHVDWREKGYVTPVKNQGHCGSCWTFSSTGAVEGQYFRATGKLVSLSEQQLVDCSSKFGEDGCRGGYMDNAFSYIKENGIEAELSYPYKGYESKKCQYNKTKIVTKVSGNVDIRHGSEEDLEVAVATVGPISVGIDASLYSFQNYNGGVYDDPNCSTVELDHAVLVVGYGITAEGKKYWIVKNSWTENWGLNGYILMSRGRNNQCGIATMASYPIV